MSCRNRPVCLSVVLSMSVYEQLGHNAFDAISVKRPAATDLTSRVLGSTFTLIVPPFVFQLV